MSKLNDTSTQIIIAVNTPEELKPKVRHYIEGQGMFCLFCTDFDLNVIAGRVKYFQIWAYDDDVIDDRVDKRMYKDVTNYGD